MPPTGSAPKPKAEEDVPCVLRVMTRQMRKSAGPIASGGHASLPGGSPLLCGVERENSSWAAADFLPEIDDNESSFDCLFLEIAVMDDGASAFVELRVSTEQYSFAPVGAYIPMPAKEYSAMESTLAGIHSFHIFWILVFAGLANLSSRQEKKSARCRGRVLVSEERTGIGVRGTDEC
ncbi:hypothetical protein Taro_001129 [Colocasia esculenta]|uniref:Uncharacterized protein n=1 Tax=Colocasia esculenta TaxID=4460 RepID=A0A843TI94_COLES|nr:hypothetical protein [Colocasia esculenta]